MQLNPIRYSIAIMFLHQHLLPKKKENEPCSVKKKSSMVDAALFAIREIMEEFPEAVLYGQDVGEG